MTDNEKYITKLQDGELAVKTIAQTGDIIPEEGKDPSRYTTALVQTENGVQLCQKVIDLSGGGGSGGGGADTSLSNITNDGKQVITEMAAPSSTYDVLTPTNNATYTAPADGWFVFYGITLSTNNDAYIYHAGNSENRMNSIRVFATTVYGNDKIIGVSYPAKSGEVVGLAFTNVKFTDVDYSNLGLRFFYLEGNKPEGN